MVSRGTLNDLPPVASCDGAMITVLPGSSISISLSVALCLSLPPFLCYSNVRRMKQQLDVFTDHLHAADQRFWVQQFVFGCKVDQELGDAVTFIED